MNLDGFMALCIWIKKINNLFYIIKWTINNNNGKKIFWFWFFIKSIKMNIIIFINNKLIKNSKIINKKWNFEF